MVKQRQTWYPVNAISILRSDQIGRKLQSESARELSGYVSYGIDIYLNDVPGKFTHRDAAKRRIKISPCPECFWPQSHCGRDVKISTATERYLPNLLWPSHWSNCSCWVEHAWLCTLWWRDGKTVSTMKSLDSMIPYAIRSKLCHQEVQ